MNKPVPHKPKGTPVTQKEFDKIDLQAAVSQHPRSIHPLPHGLTVLVIAAGQYNPRYVGRIVETQHGDGFNYDWQYVVEDPRGDHETLQEHWVVPNDQHHSWRAYEDKRRKELGAMDKRKARLETEVGRYDKARDLLARGELGWLIKNPPKRRR